MEGRSGLMDYMDAYRLVSSYGIRTVPGRYVGSADEAVRFASGKPIVMKALSPKALHKSKSGLVALGVDGKEEIGRAFSSLRRKAERYRPYKLLAQQMVPFSEDNVEIIVGGNEDAQFGKMVLLGLGGIYVEAFRDFSLRICPITREDAESMIDDLKSGHVMAKDERSRRMIVDLLLRASKMLTENSGVRELDLNPVILHGDTYSAVDLRILR